MWPPLWASAASSRAFCARLESPWMRHEWIVGSALRYQSAVRKGSVQCGDVADSSPPSGVLAQARYRCTSASSLVRSCADAPCGQIERTQPPPMQHPSFLQAELLAWRKRTTPCERPQLSSKLCANVSQSLQGGTNVGQRFGSTTGFAPWIVPRVYGIDSGRYRGSRKLP